MAGLGITRKEGESWRDCAIRYASLYDLEAEVTVAFDGYIEDGDKPEDAAWKACYDWDVLDLVE
jgi:hypothetical protein